ncbi:MAG: MFS transporter [Qingshengfaniella sp.]
MTDRTARRRIWGWYFFDWASQPYNTLLLTFIFAPYMRDLIGDGSRAQAIWGYGVGAAGILIALVAPLLGGIADVAGPHVRLRFIRVFSVFYVLGSAGLWNAVPGDFSLVAVMGCFVLGLIGMELATIFTNAMLPGLAPPDQIGRISGTGWAFGYLGGLSALTLVLLFFAENARTGVTLIGIPPLFGLDPALREGTRAVGPLTAIWYAVFVTPFFLWVREPRAAVPVPLAAALRMAFADLRAALRRLPGQRSLAAFLAASMFYREALNGLYFFGGIYAAGVLDWTVVDVGVFGLLAVLTGAVFAWLGGQADMRFGPKPVVLTCILALICAALAAVLIAPGRVLGVTVPDTSRLPDLAFYGVGMMVGAAGGALQAASRSLMTRQAEPGRITQGFGLYALAGKASAFVAPFSVALVTDLTGSQQIGILPLLGLFLMGLVLLFWVRADGDRPR